MPHIHIEYSANLEPAVDMGALCEALRATVAGIDTFPVPGIRVRATRVDHVAMADGDPGHGFIDLVLRLREGRSDAVMEDAITRVFAALKDYMAPTMETRSVALSAEIRKFRDEFAPKFGNVRAHMEANA